MRDELPPLTEDDVRLLLKDWFNPTLLVLTRQALLESGWMMEHIVDGSLIKPARHVDGGVWLQIRENAGMRERLYRLEVRRRSGDGEWVVGFEGVKEIPFPGGEGWEPQFVAEREDEAD